MFASTMPVALNLFYSKAPRYIKDSSAIMSLAAHFQTLCVQKLESLKFIITLLNFLLPNNFNSILS